MKCIRLTRLCILDSPLGVAARDKTFPRLDDVRQSDFRYAVYALSAEKTECRVYHILRVEKYLKIRIQREN